MACHRCSPSLDAVFDERQKRIVENPDGGLESDAVLFTIAAALVLVPFVPHRYTYRITAWAKATQIIENNCA
jgi:hypothetical protein